MKAATQRKWSSLAASAMLLLVQACASEDPGSETDTTPVPLATAETEATAFDISTIAAADLLAALEGDDAPVVLDVRTPEEFEAGHIPGAINLPHDQIEARLGSLDDYRDRDVVVYCRTGRRAEIVEQVLRSAGFERVSDLEGHMVFWKAYELPLDVLVAN